MLTKQNDTMPTLGEIKSQRHHPHIWAACTSCGKERWVRLVNGTPRSTQCHSCGPSPHQLSQGQASHRDGTCPVCSVTWGHKQHAAHLRTTHPEYVFRVVHEHGSSKYLCATCNHTCMSLIGLVSHYTHSHPSAIRQPPLSALGDNHQVSPGCIELTTEQILNALRYMINDREALVVRVANTTKAETQNTELAKRVATLEAQNRELAKSLQDCRAKNTILLNDASARYRCTINEEMLKQSLENTGR